MSSEQLERNKRNVMAFYDLMFNECRPAEAIERYAGIVYIQHNPQVADGKETREINGRRCVLEHAIRGDVAIVKAWKGDRWGNLLFRKTSRNFNPLCAQAGKVTIVEVEHLVEVGELDPDQVHLPSIYVQRIFQGQAYDKPIEQRTVRPRPEKA